MKPLHKDLREFLRLLNEAEVRYLIVGGLAVIDHEYVRYTGDTDIWIPVDEATADRVVGVLRRFGFDDPGLDRSLFLSPRNIVRLGYEHNRIEIGTGISGVEFEACDAARETADIDGIQVPFINLGHLKVNKRAAGRTKDQAILENLP